MTDEHVVEEAPEREHSLVVKDPGGVAEAVRLILFALATTGLVSVTDDEITAIVGGVMGAIALISIAVTVWQRRLQWAKATVEDMGALAPKEDPATFEPDM